ncbi:MAG: oxidoreductase, short chain dehydrogenase/reductase family [uncultured bacterium]|nr:MAG: oxidoreductase, short chain dehydrogenase/reductase family [uncultured bacterium]
MEQHIAVVTGVSKGIGEAIGNKFENESIKVIGFSRTPPKGKCTYWIQGDITVKEDRERFKNEVLKKFGRIDVLVNNAGMGLIDTWEETKLDDLRKIFELNFFSLVDITKSFIPELKKSKGTIINVSSFLGKSSIACMGGYCATKFAVNAFSDSLRMELKPYGVHVLNLIVGLTDTSFKTNCLGSRKMPVFPSIGNPNTLANKVYQAFLKRKKEIFYPGWYYYMLAFIRLFPGLNEDMNIKQWNLK